MKYTFRPKGVCAMQIEFEIENNIVTNVEFMGGCNGNLKAISKLVEGMPAEDIINKLEGNTCGFKSTSCADQFALALKQAISE